MKIKYIIILGVLLISGSMITWAMKGKLFRNQEKAKKVMPIADQIPEPKIYDPLLLKNFETVSKNMDGSKPEYLVSGTINSINQADTTDVMRNVEYLFSKKGKDFYYKLGQTETINANGLYIHIDHEAKKVLISKQKEVNVNPGLIDAGSLIKGLKSEYYELLGKMSGKDRTISLLNEHHITCKEYSITYDTLSMKAWRIYSRMTNFHDPLRKDNEKIIDVRINQWNDESDIEKYISSPIVSRRGNHWELNEKYTDYELVEM